MNARQVVLYDSVDYGLLKFVVIISSANRWYILCKHRDKDI